MILDEKDYDRHVKIVQTQNRIRLLKVILFFMLLILAVITVYNLDFGSSIDYEELVQSDAYINGPECENLSFKNTAICLNDFARKNFHYNLTDDSLTLTIHDMMERGGDCRDWTFFYQTNMAYYGFNNSQRVKIFVDEDEDHKNFHVYLNIAHSSGYCNIDITNLECYDYVNDDGEVKE